MVFHIGSLFSPPWDERALTAFKAVQRSEQDIMNRRRGLMILLLLGAAGLIGFSTHRVRSSVKADTASVELVKALICTSCNHRYEASIAAGPVACPQCKQTTGWPAVKCLQCGTVFGCNKKKFRAEGREPYCPKCNSIQLAIAGTASTASPGEAH